MKTWAALTMAAGLLVGPLAAAPGASAQARPDVLAGPRVGGPHIMPLVQPGQARRNTASHQLYYYGGKVISNADVQQVYWGSGTYMTGTAPGDAQLPAFLTSVGSSAYMDWLSEYNTKGHNGLDGQPGSNQLIGRFTYRGQQTITPAALNNLPVIDDTNMRAELAAQLDAHTVVAPKTDSTGAVTTLYALLFPSGKTLTENGATGGVQFCAYHGTLVWQGLSVPYMVLPDFNDPGYPGHCGGNPTQLNNFTSVTSHEIVESVTDAEVGIGTTVARPLAWYDPTFNGEIGDICNGQQGTVNGYTVQLQWSNASDGCIATRAGSTPDFSMSVGPSSQTAKPDAPASYTVTTALVGPSPQPVTLSVSGLPAGVTGAFTPSSVVPGSPSTLKLTAAPGTPAQASTPFTVTGTGPAKVHTGGASVTVQDNPPGAPTIGPATGGSGHATVTWTAPGNHGDTPITGYVVTPYVGTTAKSPVVFHSTATSQSVPGLVNGTLYRFKVAASNGFVGPQSAASGLVLPPFTSLAAFTGRQIEDFQGRAARPDEINAEVAALQGGAAPGAFMAAQRTSPDATANVDPVTRLYFAYLQRIPDAGGLRYWIGQKRGGKGLATISQVFASSHEFTTKYGALTNRQFVTRIYTDVLGRPADTGGVNFWTAQLDSGKKNRGQVMIGFSESNEYKNKKAAAVSIVVTWISMLGVAPVQSEFDSWITMFGSGKTVADLAATLLADSRYASHLGT